MTISKNSSVGLFKSHSFSHIYVEHSVQELDSTQEILDHYRDSQIIPIKHYKDVFNRKKQNWLSQKKFQNLILARKPEPFIYKTDASTLPPFNYKAMHYISSVINCIYDCDYCYLQGAYPSAHMVVFQNFNDFNHAIHVKKQTEPMDAIALSYDSDILALENKLHHIKHWMPIISKYPDIDFEIRTKSANFNAIKHFNPLSNIILAWSLSPSEVISSYETLTPKLEQRLQAISLAAQNGWNIRLCFDPIMHTPNFEDVFTPFLNLVFSRISTHHIKDVYFNVFRMNTQYFSNMKSIGKSSPAFYYPYTTQDNMKSYSKKTHRDIAIFMNKELNRFLPSEKIFSLL